MANFNRILIIATRQIGDVLCTTPLMRRARELWPDAVIDVLGYEKTMGMLVGNSHINEVIESPEHPRWPEYKILLRRIFRKYDLAIVTQPSDRAHIYGLFAAPKRVGIVAESTWHHWWKKLLCVQTVQLDYWAQHVVIERLRLLDRFGDSGRRTELELSASVTPPASVALPDDLVRFVEAGKTIVVHATPMWRFKRWPVQSWVHLIVHVINLGWHVVLTGSSSQQDHSLNLELEQEVEAQLGEADRGRLRNCAGLLSLGQTTTLLKVTELYVGVDTSITHLAAACGKPTIALFGPTAPPNFGPWPRGSGFRPQDRSIWRLRGQATGGSAAVQKLGNVSIVQGPGDCVPCRKAGCDNHFGSASHCLDNLSWQDVARLIGEVCK
jgi:heptosyltransferase III